MDSKSGEEGFRSDPSWNKMQGRGSEKNFQKIRSDANKVPSQQFGGNGKSFSDDSVIKMERNRKKREGLIPRILVIDDNPAIHEDIQKILVSQECSELEELNLLEAAFLGSEIDEEESTQTFELDFARQGQEGYELVEYSLKTKTRYALAFVDIRMPPGWDGIESAKKLWELDPDLQIIICTAYSDYSWEEMAQELGVTEKWVILKKPFDPIEVRQLAHALTKKWELWRENRRHAENLERLVQSRTNELEVTNSQLRKETNQRMRIEADLRRAHKLESLGRLAAGVGHEINNPLSYLSATLGLIDDILRKNQGDLSKGRVEETRQLLEEALIGADKIARVVRDLKSFCRFDEEEPGPVDLHDTLELSINMIKNEAHHRAKIIRKIVPELWAKGYRSRLEQVFVNLLLNAAQSIPEGRAAENAITINAYQSQKTVIVEIVDTGPGIPAEDIERIFDPFFTTKPVGKGMGLGLSVCYSIVNSLGGDIAVESTVGEGTTVKVILPQTTPTPADIQKKRRRSSNSTTDSRVPVHAQVLVVDDEQLVARSMERMLSHHTTTVAQSGREALELCQRVSFDVIFCDLMMDDLSGIDVYDRLKSEAQDVEKRIIFVTGGAFTDRAQTFLDNISNYCIEKPFTRNELEQALQNIISEFGHRNQ